MKTQSRIEQSQKPASTRSANHLGDRRERRGEFSGIDFGLRLRNQSLETERVLEMLRREAPRFFQLSAVVGRWVWVQFPEPQPRRVTALLSEFGFHWSRRRQCWQHPCGVFSDSISSSDPRETYGCYYPSQSRRNV